MRTAILLLAGTLFFNAVVYGQLLTQASVRQFWVEKTSEQTRCVSFETPSRVLAGNSFTTPIGNGLKFRLRSEPAGTWGIMVGPAGTPLDYLWVTSPPFQTAPHRQIGRGYSPSATESAQLSPRRFRFITTTQEYEEAVALFDRAGRDGLAVTVQDFEKRGRARSNCGLRGMACPMQTEH